MVALVDLTKRWPLKPDEPGISSGKLANLANSVSEKIDAGTAVSSDWSRGFPSLSLRYRL